MFASWRSPVISRCARTRHWLSHSGRGRRRRLIVRYIRNGAKDGLCPGDSAAVRRQAGITAVRARKRIVEFVHAGPRQSMAVGKCNVITLHCPSGVNAKFDPNDPGPTAEGTTNRVRLERNSRGQGSFVASFLGSVLAVTSPPTNSRTAAFNSRIAERSNERSETPTVPCAIGGPATPWVMRA